MPDPTKRCPGCKASKPLDAFHRNRSKGDGRQGYCKPCCRNCRRTWRKRNPEQARAEEGRRSARSVAQKKAAIREWKIQHPEATRAHDSVYYALKIGKLTRPETCSLCGGNSRLHAHHEDYARPLDVQWLCSRCHQRLHAGTLTTATGPEWPRSTDRHRSPEWPVRPTGHVQPVSGQAFG